MPKNYYLILGIPKDSTQADIKSAYRRLAKELHPDYFGTNQTPFQIIQEAYSVLGNPEKRRSYDIATRKSNRNTGDRRREVRSHNLNSEIEPLVPHTGSLYENLTQLDRTVHHLWNTSDVFYNQFPDNFVEDLHYVPKPHRNMTVEIQLNSRQAQFGGNVHLNIPVSLRCPSCSPYLKTAFYSCWRCNGTGFLSGKKRVLLSIPPNITHNHSLKFDMGYVDGKKLVLTAIFKI